jgi:hypothetical protein
LDHGAGVAEYEEYREVRDDEDEKKGLSEGARGRRGEGARERGREGAMKSNFYVCQNVIYG